MARQKLTVGFVNAVRAPSPSGKQHLFWDTEIKGFGLLVSGSSNVKSYFYQGLVAGRSRRVTLGSAFVLTAEDARKLARDRAREMLDGFRGIGRRAAAARQGPAACVLDTENGAAAARACCSAATTGPRLRRSSQGA